MYIYMIRNYFVIILLCTVFIFSCATVQSLPMETAEEKASAALIILGNPTGSYPVTNGDIPELLEFSKDPNPAVRHMAVFQLQQLKSTSFFGDILPLLVDGDLSVSRNTEELLLKNRDAAVRVFRDALSGENSLLILRILDILVLLDDKDSLSEIIELFNSSDEEIVDKAVYSAAEIADINDRILFETLLRPETAMRVGIVETFSKLGDPSVLGTLLPYFYDPDVKVQNAVKFAFINFGSDSVPYLLNVLNNPVPETQLAVLGLLEALHDKNTISSVLELFSSENERVRNGAVYIVSTFGAEAVPALGEALRKDEENTVIKSIELLADVNNMDALQLLIPLLGHKNSRIANTAFDSILTFEEDAGDQFLKIIDRREYDLYESAVRALVMLRDARLVVDSNTSLFNQNNRNRAFILNSTQKELDDYLGSIAVSGLIARDLILIKKINQSASLLIKSEREISESGSKYTTFYISKNDFLKKSDEALQLSFSFMHNYMESKDPHDLETARKQQSFSEMFKTAAEDLDIQLKNYIGSTERERELIVTFEESKDNIISLYESVSLNRKNLADDILAQYGLTYKDIAAGNLSFL